MSRLICRHCLRGRALFSTLNVALLPRQRPRIVARSRLAQPPQSRQSPLVNEQLSNEPIVDEDYPGNVPWYLQEEKDTGLASNESKSLEMPLIPSGCPTIVEPIVKFSFTSCKVTDMSIVSLDRAISPWGSDFTMVIGTCRGERHLRSTAESITSFVKYELQFPIHVEGLPKQNNLKVQRRRMKRRVSGKREITKPYEPFEWICLEVLQNPVVIQLFTPEGREKYDLDSLWGQPNNGASRSLSMYEKKTPLSRSYSTLREFRNHSQNAVDCCYDQVMSALLDKCDIAPDYNKQRQLLGELASDGDVLKCQRLAAHMKRNDNDDPSFYVFKAFINKLKKTEAITAKEMLSDGNSFKNSFIALFPGSMEAIHWWYYLEFYLTANKINADSYPIESVGAIVASFLATSSSTNSDDLGHLLFKIQSSPELEIAGNAAQNAKTTLKKMQKRVNILLQQFKHFHYIGGVQDSLVDAETLSALFVACFPQLLTSTEIHRDSHSTLPYLYKAKDLIRVANSSSIIQSSRFVDLTLIAFASTNRWKEFWKQWNMLALVHAGRTQQAYSLVWKLVSESGNQKAAQRALNDIWGSMLREDTQVFITSEMAEAIKLCVTIAQDKPIDSIRGFSHVLEHLKTL